MACHIDSYKFVADIEVAIQVAEVLANKFCNDIEIRNYHLMCAKTMNLSKNALSSNLKPGLYTKDTLISKANSLGVDIPFNTIKRYLGIRLSGIEREKAELNRQLNEYDSSIAFLQGAV